MSDRVFYLEPANKRYHAKIDCPVLLGQQDIEVVIVKHRPTSVRPCAVCGYDVGSPVPRLEEPRGGDGHASGRGKPGD